MGRPGCHHGMEQKERMEDFGPRRPCMCSLVYSIIITSSAGHSLYFKNSSGGSEPPQESLLNIFAKPCMECAVHVCWRLAVSRLGQQVD